MLKKIILGVIISIASLNAQADIKEIKGITAYNATILGYAMNCNLPKNKIDSVKNQFLSNLQKINLTKKDENEVKKIFFDTISIAKEKGPENSNMICFTFKDEFEKIYQAVSTGRVRQ